MTGRWGVALAAAGTAALLVVPGWLRAAPAGAPALMVPPGRTQPTGPLLPWDGSAAPPELGDFVWCQGDAATGGCRGFNADDFAITHWARQHVIDPYLAANPPPAWTPTANPTAAPATATALPAPATATVGAATASPGAAPATATPAPSPATATPTPPVRTVACQEVHYVAPGPPVCVTEE